MISAGPICPRPSDLARASEDRSWVVQADALNHSRLTTVICVPLTSNLRWADAPRNVYLARVTGLPKDSAANVSQIIALDRGLLSERVGKLSAAKLQLVLAGIDVVLGR